MILHQLNEAYSDRRMEMCEVLTEQLRQDPHHVRRICMNALFKEKS